MNNNKKNYFIKMENLNKEKNHFLKKINCPNINNQEFNNIININYISR